MRVAENDIYQVCAYDDSGVITIKQSYGGDADKYYIKINRDEVDLLVHVLFEAKRLAGGRVL